MLPEFVMEVQMGRNLLEGLIFFICIITVWPAASLLDRWRKD